MEENIYNKIFNFKITNGQKINITNNEIYNQLLLYIFFSVPGDLLILTPTLNEANKVFNNLKKYIDNTYIFPEDEYLAKKAIAVSTELLYMRIKILNSLKNKDKKIIVSHVGSFIKKLPNPLNYQRKFINIQKNHIIDRDSLISKLIENGYTKESFATNTGEFAVRGFVIDIFPIDEEHPIRIDFFDNEIEKIAYFDEINQKTLYEINSISIKPLKDEFLNNDSIILDYLNNPYVILQDIEQCNNVMSSIVKQIKYYDNDFSTVFNLEEINIDNYIYIDLINNNGIYDRRFISSSIPNFNNNYEEYIKFLKDDNSYLCTNDEKFIKKVKNDYNNLKYIKTHINSGFVFNGIKYVSNNDLVKTKLIENSFKGYKLGKKINNIEKLAIGDYVVHKNHGIGIYKGIKTISKNSIKKDYILVQYHGNDKLYLSIDSIDKLYKYSSREGVKPKINKLNSIEWEKTKLRIKSKIKNITDELLEIYRKRSQIKVEPFLKDEEFQILFESEFPYEYTIDQAKATLEIKKDLESGFPMERLLCGDVGYGKTEVIFRAMFKTVMNNKQTLYMCPTTLLSKQQHDSALDRFKNYSVNIALLNRHTSESEAKKILKDLENGKIDILFGTHRLLSNDIKIKDLGLLVIDEEHRFGVLHKEKIKKLKSNVHVLSVSATPIPRSLQMSLVGIRDLSLIESAPKNRYPVQTYVINYDKYILREIILKEKGRNGQVFILYNKIEDMEVLLNEFKNLIPEVSITYAHGKMSKYQMSDVMDKFSNGEYDVLLSTTIIENGIDIPNANTMIVIDADKFGLSQLYQIRGRVGRGEKIAYAYLMYDKNKVLSETAIKRLEAIKEFTELGSGYKISMRDLSIRGAGDILGREQAGFIDSVGVDMYLDLVNEQINNIDKTNEKDLVLDDVDTHIDTNYCQDEEVIISIHKKITSIESMEDLNNIREEIKDQFGYIDKKIDIYMYQELFEKLLNKYNIKLNMNTKEKISLRLEENLYKKLNIEDLFINASRLTTKFNFIYRGNFIIIELNKFNLEEHYIYYLANLLVYIENHVSN